ncbi:MAG: hypothetical protein AAF984_03075 [Verrucomicrobiota bacterium]
MHDLVEIIQNECVAERNCMLTVQNQGGEAGFLYFKEAQLIEASSAGEWGPKAFAEILNWQIESYSISELPMGIKRTLWDPVDKLIEDVRGVGSASGVREAVKNLSVATIDIESEKNFGFQDDYANFIRMLTEQVKKLEGVICLYHEMNDRIRLLTGTPPIEAIDADWLESFTGQIENLGSGLGGGRLRFWYCELEQYRIWHRELAGGFIYVITNRESSVDDFDAKLNELLEDE